MQNTKLKDVAYLAGRIGWKGLTAKEYTEKGPLFLSVHGLNYGDYVDFQDAFHISQERYDESPEIMLQEEDILLCKDGAGIGKLGMIDHLPAPASINSSLLLIRALDGVFPKYLYYSLCSPIFQRIVQERIDGATTPHLYQREIKQLEIPLPPLEEQKRIVGILDEAFAGIDQAIANTEKNLQNARDLFESYLNNIFTQKGDGWVEKKLCELCDKITDGTHQTPKYFDDGYIFLSSRNVTRQVIDWDNIKYIDEAQHVAMQKRIAPRKGDILLAKNGTTGVAAMVDKDVIFDIYVSLAHIRSLGEIKPELLLKYINSPLAKKQFDKRLKGTGVPNLHLKEIREVIVTFPSSKTEQEKLIVLLSGLQKQSQRLEATYTKKLNALKELKQSLLQKAFAGELTADKQEAA